MRLPWYTSMVIIVLCFVFIIPIPLGILLLSIRVSKERQLSYTAGRTKRLVGFILLIYALIMYAYTVDTGDTEAGSTAVMMFVIPGILFIVLGNKSISKGKLLGSIHNSIYTGGIRSIHQLATSFKVHPNVMMNHIRLLQQRGFLPGAVIANYMITLPQDVQVVAQTAGHLNQTIMNNPHNPQMQQMQQQMNHLQQQVNANNQVASQPKEKVKRPPKSVACPGCGSKSVLHDGDVRECEFCGTNLTYDM